MEEIGTTHEDRLRALGWYLDNRKLSVIGLTFNVEGVALTAREQAGEPVTQMELRLTPAELMELCEQGAKRRGSGGQRAARPSRLSALQAGQHAPTPLSQWLDQTQTLSYQEALRAIGFDLDRWGAKWYRIDEQDHGMVIRYRTTSNGPDINQVYPITKEEVRVRIAKSIRRRGSGPGTIPATGTGR
jgi:hypothetical protein